MERYSNLIVRIAVSKINLSKDYDNALLVMAEIEGEGWLEGQLTDPSPNVSAKAALEQVQRRQREFREWKSDYPGDKPPDLNDTVGDAIYGAGGFNRYFVRGNGEIIFSRSHSTAEDLAKAKKLGFEVW